MRRFLFFLIILMVISSAALISEAPVQGNSPGLAEQPEAAQDLVPPASEAAKQGTPTELEKKELPLIQEAVKQKGARWMAGETSVTRLSPEKRKRLCGTLPEPEAKGRPSVKGDRVEERAVGLPAAFDWRNYNGGNWMTSVKDQGSCGSCWAFGSLAAFEAGTRIKANNYNLPIDLSEQFLLSCSDGDCIHGWYISSTLDYLKNTGTVDETCLSYQASDSIPCSSRCSDWQSRIEKIRDWAWVGGGWGPVSASTIKQALIDYGPLPSYMMVYTDFFYYKSGVYRYTLGSAEGGHLVTLVGWDDSGGYWIGKNSWGTGWGESGYFRIRMGANEVQIEEGTAWLEADPPPAPSGPPTVTNLPPSDITSTSARLNGNLISSGNAATTVHIYWGNNDGGTNPANWDHDVNLGTRAAGTFHADVSSLTEGTTYYYRCFAENSAGSTWADSTTSFVARTLVKLLGADDSTATGGATPSALFLEKWTATSSGTLTTIRIKGTAPGYAKVAIYTDNAGNPGAVLVKQDASTPISPGWNDITLPSTTTITAGTSYWLAYVADSRCVGYVATSHPGRWKSVTYSTFTFIDNPTGLTSHNQWYNQLAGCGTFIVSLPAVTNLPPSNITSTSARLRGDLTSTGGVATTVRIYWGDNDGGTNPANWDHDVNLGTRGIGTFYTDVSTLTEGTTYYYRCFAENSADSTWADSTTSFVARTLVKLLGADDSTATGGATPSALFLEKWTATSSGTLTTIRIKGTAPGNVKVAIYTDNAGNPGAVLAKQDASTPISLGWNDITLPSTTTITAGTSYWLAYVADSRCVGYVATSHPGRWKSVTYSTFTFSDNPTGLTSHNQWYNQLAGWGTSQ